MALTRMMIKKELINGLLSEVNTEQDLFGKDGLLKVLTRELVEGLLNREMSYHLGYEKHEKNGYNSGNSRNGKSSKKIKTGNGTVEISVPRDRAGEFAPSLIGKRQTRLSELDGIVKSEVRQSHSIFLRMFFENIQPVTRHYGAPWGAY
ncbi:MAG: hypothetical protein GY782_08790 [Gammaproteobacteria bacterium]|nr:hypothetical protein [Gammaproteobacteria bacterium]